MCKLFLILMLVAYLLLSSLQTLIDKNEFGVYGVIFSLSMFALIGFVATQGEIKQ
jgi:hypothetical protein